MKNPVLWLLAAFLLAACSTVGETYTLGSGETLQGDQYLAVVEAELAPGSLIVGDVNITASQVIISGHIQGDLTVVASDLEIADSALIEGDLIYCLVREKHFRQDEAAVVWGRVRSSCDPNTVSLETEEKSSVWLLMLGNVVLSLGAGLLAALGIIFFPLQMARVSLAAQEHRFTAGGLGCLTLLVAAGLFNLWRFSLVLVVPLVLAPLVASVGFVLVVFTLFGVVSVALPFGDWLLQRLHIASQLPLVAATLGAVVLTFFILSFRIIPALALVSSVLSALLVAWVLGAVLLTRAGTCVYNRD